MERKVILAKWIVEKLLGKTAEEIKTIIGEIKDTDYSEYDDVVMYEMVNGEKPSGDYFCSGSKVGCHIEYSVSDECAEKLAYAAKNASTYEEFLEKMYSIPFYRLDEEFSNCYKLTTIKEVSKNEVKEAFGGKIEFKTHVPVNRPRYFKVKYNGQSPWHDSFYVVQPDRRKPIFISITQCFMTDQRTGKLFRAGHMGPFAEIIKGQIAIEY